MTGSAFPANGIDFTPVKKGSTYYLWYKNDDTDYINLASSSSLLRLGSAAKTCCPEGDLRR